MKIIKKIEKYKKNKEYKKIINGYKKIIEIESKNNRQTSFPYRAISFNYGELGDYKNGIDYHLKAIELEESISGQDSIEVANLLEGLEFFYRGGKYYLPPEKHKKVLNIYWRVLKIKENVYGINSIQVKLIKI